MTAGRLIFPGYMPAEDANGDRIAGARAYFYENGTTTAATVYTASDLVTPHGVYVEADSVGVWPAMWADTTDLFSVVLTDSDAVPLSSGSWSGFGPLIDATLAAVTLTEEAAAEAAQSATAAAASAASAAASDTGISLVGTSITNNTIGTGAKTFTLAQPALDFAVGMKLYAADNAAPATNRMVGLVTAFADPLITISVPVGGTTGAGASASWTIGLAGENGVTSLAGLTGVVSAAAAKAALAVATTDITDLATYTAARNAFAVAAAVAL